MAERSQIQAGKIAVYNLGEKGVVITKSPLHGEDGELAQAQNAVPNPEGGLQGIRKRIGFAALNASAAAGGILAFISCNLEDPGVIAINPALFGRWLYSTDAGATWSYLEVQQSVDSADIPPNFDGFNRLAFLHTTVDTDKTGLIAIDQVAGVNQWEESDVPAVGYDPGRIPYTIPHTLDLGDGYLYYVGSTGLTIRRWGYGVDELVATVAAGGGATPTAIVDWDTDGTDIWVLCDGYATSAGASYGLQAVWKIDVSANTATRVGLILNSTWSGTTPAQVIECLCYVDLGGDTPSIVVGGSVLNSNIVTGQEPAYNGVCYSIGAGAADTDPWTKRFETWDTRSIPTGHAWAILTAQANLQTPTDESLTSYGRPIVQFAVGDTITIGDMTYRAVEKATLANNVPGDFFRGGVWQTTQIQKFGIDPSLPGAGPGSIRVPTYYYIDGYLYTSGITALVDAVNKYGNGFTTSSTPANPLCSATNALGNGVETLQATSRTGGTAGNGITVSETSSIASWDAGYLSHGLYTQVIPYFVSKVHDIINDATSGNLFLSLSSTGGHANIKKTAYPTTTGAWTPAWADVRSQLYPFGYISVWADGDELLYLETPEEITLQVSKGVKVDAAVFFLLGTGVETDATINLIALSDGALQRMALPS